MAPVRSILAERAPASAPGLKYLVALSESLEVEVRVQDHGIGMPQHQQARIFGRFSALIMPWPPAFAAQAWASIYATLWWSSTADSSGLNRAKELVRPSF